MRGGIDHAYASSQLGKACTAENYQCAIPITHNNLRNTTTAVWKQSEQYLDWYGAESAQNATSEGTAMDWTTNLWPASYGPLKTVVNDGFGQEVLNEWGEHYWMLDVQMDCSKTVNGWFELKAYVKNGQGFESDVQQTGTPYPSSNHFAQCGKINQFDFNSSTAYIEPF